MHDSESRHHERFLAEAAAEARKSVAEGGKGVGAVLVKDETIVARSCDRTHQLNDPIAVAEMDCIRRAGRRADQSELTLYSTGYPDMLTAGTLLQFSIGALVVGRTALNSDSLKLLAERQLPVKFIPHTDCTSL
ncbi:MAG: deaminase [Pseudomonadota bacterium]